MNFKLTKEERNWVLYDVGNSAFTMLIATILPIYFNYLAASAGLSSVDYLAYWGYAASITTLIVAFLGPVTGSLTDIKGYKKPIFMLSLAVGSVACVSLGFCTHWMVFLIVFILSKIGYSCSLIYYDSMLSDVTVEERMDHVSSMGYALGYIGSCIPFVACLVLVLGSGSFGMAMSTAMMLSFLIIAAWWVVMTLPLLKTYRQKHYIEKQQMLGLLDSFKRLGSTLKNIKKEKKIFLFLLAFFFYIDGVYTIIDMATAYGSALGLDSTGLLLALLVTQIVAFPFAILFGRLAQKYNTTNLITICIFCYFCIAVYAIFLHTQFQFWVLAVFVGMFQGGIQALSRSYFTKIIPPEQSGEFFGLYDICGKGASFMGTFAVSLLSQLSGNTNIGVGALSVFFIIGLVLFRKAARIGA